MKKFTVRRELGGALKVFDADKNCVAVFGAGKDGVGYSTAFMFFKKGLSLTIGAELYDEDRGQYLVGTIEQLGLAPVKA